MESIIITVISFVLKVVLGLSVIWYFLIAGEEDSQFENENKEKADTE